MTRLAWACIIVAAAFVLVAMQPGPAQAATCRGQMVWVSWYGAESGNRTASGRYFDGTQLLAAHRTLKFGTKVRFTYKGRSIILPILDRGPYVGGRTYDLSKAAAKRIGMVGAGVVNLCAEVL